MKKSGIANAGAGNENENGQALVADIVLVETRGEPTAEVGGWRCVRRGRGRRWVERNRQLGRRGWRCRPVCRAGCGRHFVVEPPGPLRGAGVTVTVTVVVVLVVVVDVGLLGAAGSAGVTTVVVGVPAAPVVLVEPRLGAAPDVVAIAAAPGPAPSTSATHHPIVDIHASRSARAVAVRPTGLVHAQRDLRVAADSPVRVPAVRCSSRMSPDVSLAVARPAGTGTCSADVSLPLDRHPGIGQRA